ncbi:hypothetical protein B0H14DRAFT_148868 [Mycena olivaceomarginata]|nr:hypothetical protein B0H14DRAFT_148868 [Mycena olivaceomarginata]
MGDCIYGAYTYACPNLARVVESFFWSGFLWIACLMSDNLVSARGRTPAMVNAQDQLLLCGSPPPLESLLETLELSVDSHNSTLLWVSTKTYMFHVTTLAREPVERITGDFARTRPLSEAVVHSFFNSLSNTYSVLSLLLDRIDTLIAATASINPPALLADSRTDFLAVTAAFCCCFGFSALVLPFYRELQYREASDGSDTSEPLLALRMQAHGLAVLGARNLARGIRYLPKIHYAPAQWATIRQWAEFAAEEADMETAPLSPEAAYDLETLADELKLLGYSLHAACTPETVALIERLESHVNRALGPMFLSVDGEADADESPAPSLDEGANDHSWPSERVSLGREEVS